MIALMLKTRFAFCYKPKYKILFLRLYVSGTESGDPNSYTEQTGVFRLEF